jgi:hypothetical protein
MTKTRVIVPLLLTLLLVSAACIQASGQTPTAYPTTGSPAFSIQNNRVAYAPSVSQTPAAAWPQASYGPYPSASERQVALYSAPAPSEPTPSPAGDCGCQPNPYASSTDCGYPAASCMTCAPEAVWVASVGGLLMSIDESHHHTFSYDTGNEADQYTDWRNDNIEWEAGFEVALRRFGACSCSGWEGIYWGLYPGATETATYDTDMLPAGNLNGILNWDQLDYPPVDPPTTTAADYVNNALVHRLRRDVEVHNAEINHVMLAGDACASPFRGEVLCGVRFFRFSDDMQFMADTALYDPIYYDIDIDNTLVGAQVGGWGEYTLGCRLSVAAGAKVGVYNNHISSYSWIGGAAGTAVINNGPNDGRAWVVDASKDDVSMLGELQLEVLYQITPCWRAGLGYRVVGATGIASPVDQIYPDLRGINDVQLVDSHSSLFMHGFTASVEYQF